MITDPEIDREMSYTTWQNSCRDIYGYEISWSRSPILCRRRQGHNGPHAAGFGSKRITWERF